MHVMPEAAPIHVARPLTLTTSWPAVPTSPGASLVTPMHVPASSTAEPLDMLPSSSLCQADRPDGAPYWPIARAHGTLAPSAAYSHSADFIFPGSVATSSPVVVANISTPSPQALTPGGFLVPSKLTQRIWKGDFIDMYELLPEKLGRSEEISSQDLDGTKRKRRKVTSALQWVECFHTYIGVIAQQQPGRVTDLLAYASLIVHAAWKFKGEGWLQYDKFFRKNAEVHPGIRWACGPWHSVEHSLTHTVNCALALIRIVRNTFRQTNHPRKSQPYQNSLIEHHIRQTDDQSASIGIGGHVLRQLATISTFA